MPNKVFPVNNWKIKHPYWILHIWISLGTKFQFKLTILFFWPNLQNKVLPINNWKIDHPYWVLHFWISAGTKFQLKLTILIFWTKFAQKGYFQSKSEKMNTTNKFCIFKSVYIPNFSLNWQFYFFWPDLPKKLFPIEKWKSEHHYWILRVWISQGTKFHLKLTILIFWTKFTQRVSGQNWKKVNDLWIPYISNF